MQDAQPQLDPQHVLVAGRPGRGDGHVEQVRQALARPAAARLDAGEEPLARPLERRQQHVVARLEVVVHGPRRDAGGAGDVGDPRRREAARDDRAAGAVEDRLEPLGAAGVGTGGAAGAALHLGRSGHADILTHASNESSEADTRPIDIPPGVRAAAAGQAAVMTLRPWLALLLVVALGAGAAACGDAETDALGERVREEVRERTERVRERAEQIRDRIEKVLGEIEAAVPRAERTRPEVIRSREEPGTIGAFLTDVLQSVDGYWTRTFAASDLPEPRVRYVWVPAGRAVATGCGTPAGDDAAFYCPADDTIYVAERFAAAIYQGLIRGLPGERSGGRAIGDFGVAYLVAHEYAHNLQAELGYFRLGRANSTKPLELQADCMAGAWGAAVYAEGHLQPGDVEEALSTVLAVGDFDYGNANHHGTPEERRAAWRAGFDSGDPSVCSQFAPA